MSWDRADHRDRLLGEHRFDVLVIGGGITGAGAALDLASRGASVALIERSDFAQGTSSRSTKLLHGGIRYLPHFEFVLVSEGLREQKILARIADFLYEPLEFIIPLYDQWGLADAPKWASRGWRGTIALSAGLWLYDLLGGPGRPGRRHRRLGMEELCDTMPSLLPEGLRGGFVYSDAQTDDARLVITVLKTAVRRHGLVATGRMAARSVTRTGSGYRVLVEDTLSGAETEVTTRAVLAATGAFEPPATGESSPPDLVRSKGVHVILSDLNLGDRALVLPETDDGRVLFIIPWLGHAMIGTTDTAYADDPAHPVADPEDIDYLLRHLGRFVDIAEAKPLSAFAGLRALADAHGSSTARASREHTITEPEPSYVRVAGGKLTTYRRIAAEAADHLSRSLGMRSRSITAEIPLVGAGADSDSLQRRLREAGLAESAVQPTVRRYGLEAEMIARLTEGDPRLAATLGDGRSTLADALYAVRHEGACRISDVTMRRTHLAWFTSDHARKDAPAIASVMGAELGWSAAQTSSELAAHDLELSAEGL